MRVRSAGCAFRRVSSRGVGKSLMGEFAGVINANGLAISVNLRQRIDGVIGLRQKWRVQALPHRHDFGIGFPIARPLAAGKFSFVQHDAVRWQKFDQLVDGSHGARIRKRTVELEVKVT